MTSIGFYPLSMFRRSIPVGPHQIISFIAFRMRRTIVPNPLIVGHLCQDGCRRNGNVFVITFNNRFLLSYPFINRKDTIQ